MVLSYSYFKNELSLTALKKTPLGAKGSDQIKEKGFMPLSSEKQGLFLERLDEKSFPGYNIYILIYTKRRG